MVNAMSSSRPADFSAARPRSRGGERRIRAWIVRGVLVLVLFVGVVELRSVASDAPALTEDLRIIGPNGDWRPAKLFDFYDRSRYLENRVGLMLEASESEPLLASTALTLAIQAVDLAPANAYNWVNLSIAAALFGMTDLAPLALERSAVLAPYNITLALQRLGLFDLLEQPLGEEAQAMVRRDLLTARTHAPSALKDLVAESAPLADFAAQIDFAIEPPQDESVSQAANGVPEAGPQDAPNPDGANQSEASRDEASRDEAPQE